MSNKEKGATIGKTSPGRKLEEIAKKTNDHEKRLELLEQVNQITNLAFWSLLVSIIGILVASFFSIMNSLHANERTGCRNAEVHHSRLIK